MMLLADRFQTGTNSHKFAHDTTAQPRQKNNTYSQHTPVDISQHIFACRTIANWRVHWQINHTNVFKYHPSNKYITQHKEHITINMHHGPIQDMVLNKHFYQLNILLSI